MRIPRRIPLFCALVFFSLSSLALHAQDVGLSVVIVPPQVPANNENTRLFSESFETLVQTEFLSAGYKVVPFASTDSAVSEGSGTEGETPDALDKAVAIANASGVRLCVVINVVVSARFLVYSVYAVDARYSLVLGSDSGSVYAGLTALAVIQDSAKAFVAHTIVRVVEAGAGSAAIPIPYAITLKSRDEGAEVFLGESQESAAVVENGIAVLPYIPLPENSRLAISLKKDGYYDSSRQVKLLGKEKAYTLPELRPLQNNALVLSWGYGRLLGMGGAYRHYLISDQVFLFGEDDLYLQYGFNPYASPVFHNDIFMGIGAYLFFDPSSAFRVSAALGGGAMLTLLPQKYAQQRFFADYYAVPFCLQFEYFIRGRQLVLEFRAPFAFDTGTGLLGQRWCMISEFLPMITLGVVLPL